MKQVRLLCFILSISFLTNISAQNYAPDWTATDLNGTTYTLSDYLNNGKHVIIDFSATWCGPCWSYHNSGTLETMYELYGPDGSDEIMVFYLESDYDTNDACIYGTSGCNDFTYGDWTAGVEYPIINLTSSNGGAVWQQYGVPGFPTVAVISATSGQFWNLVGNGASGQTILESFLFQSFSMEASGTITDANCGDDGVISSSVSGGYGSINYDWSNGMTGATIENLEEGTYLLTASDSRGHVVEESFDVDGNPNGPLAPELLSLGNVICNGDFSGFINITGTGGNGGYSYDWDNGASGSSISGLSGGMYTVLITDAIGCEKTETYEIYEPQELTVSQDVEDETCAGFDGFINANGFGGTPPFTYTLNGETNNTGSFSFLTAGTYELYITDDANCEVFHSITVNEIPGPEAFASALGEVSCTEAEVLVSGDGSTTGGNITYEWTTTDGNIVSGANEIEATVNSAGTYSLRVMDIQNNCEVIAQTSVNSNISNPVAIINSAEEITCDVTEVSLDGAGSQTGDNISYQWTTADGNIVSGENELVASVDGVGTYVLLVLDSDTGCSETAEISVTSDVNEPESNIQEPSQLTCSTTTVMLDGSGSEVGDNVSYSWSTPDGNIVDGGNTLTPVVDANGSYMLLVTNTENGCSSSKSITVTTDNTTPDVEVNNGELSCIDTKVTLCADIADGSTAVWMIGGEPVSGECAEVEAAGTYTVEVTGTNGCKATAEATVTASDDLPQVEVMEPASITCTIPMVTISATLEGNQEDFTIEWFDASGVVIANTLSTVVSEPGTYELSVIDNANGCKTLSAVTVNEIVIDPVSSYELENDNGQLSVGSTSMGDPNSFQWTVNDEVVSSEEIANLSFEENGVYTICLEVTNDCGSDTYCTDYNYATALKFEDLVTDPLCNSENSGSITVNPSGGEGNYTIAWTGPNGFSADMLSVSDLEPGTYNMILTDSYGYELADEYILVEPTAIEMTGNGTTDESEAGAADGSVEISLEGGTGDYTYAWSNGSTEAVLLGVSAGDYSVEVTDENGCSKTFGPFTVGLSTGVEDISFASDLKLYPVPANENLIVEISLTKTTNALLNVRNAQGQLIRTSNISGQGQITQTISVSEMTSGIYFLEITDGVETTTERFMVIK